MTVMTINGSKHCRTTTYVATPFIVWFPNCLVTFLFHHYFSFTHPLLPPFPLPHFALYTLAPPLTLENILTAVQGVTWKKLGKGLLYGGHSRRKYPKLDKIEEEHQSDDSRLRAVIECWLKGERSDQKPSWRVLIRILDDETKTNPAADTIRCFAEPLPGKSCDSITF